MVDHALNYQVFYIVVVEILMVGWAKIRAVSEFEVLWSYVVGVCLIILRNLTSSEICLREVPRV